MYELENAKAARHRKIVNVIMWVVLLVLFIAFIFIVAKIQNYFIVELSHNITKRDA